MTAINLTPEMRQRIEGRGDWMLSSYFIDFDPTGNDDVDLILGAVALAGKMYHSTEWWADDEDGHGYSLNDLIQAAANSAAKRLNSGSHHEGGDNGCAETPPETGGNGS